MSMNGSGRQSVLGELADELRDSLRAFMEASSPESEVRRLMVTDAGFDPAVWAQMAEQLELPGISIPERFGGSGFAVDMQAVVFEEMGRVLMCAPYLSTVLAAEALLASGDEAVCGEYLPEIASGRKRGALAVLEGRAQYELGGILTIATHVSSDETRLDGRKKFVVDGHTADFFVVVAVEGPGLELFVVDAEADGVSRHPVPTLDLTRRQAHVVFDGVQARRVDATGGAGAVVERVTSVAAVALASESAGCASRCLEMATQYAKVRYQYGRPIGSFQAVKHMCAEMLRFTEHARAAAHEAAVRVAGGNADAAMTASVAKAYCGEMAGWVAAENIQVHGGIGFTWEHPAHLYYRRAKSNEQLYGGPAHHRELVLRHLGI